jgi:hypothetical protein
LGASVSLAPWDIWILGLREHGERTTIILLIGSQTLNVIRLFMPLPNPERAKSIKITELFAAYEVNNWNIAICCLID